MKRKKIIRNLSTPESRKFWEEIEQASQEILSWPDWKRAGINVSPLRKKTKKV